MSDLFKWIGWLWSDVCFPALMLLFSPTVNPTKPVVIAVAAVGVLLLMSKVPLSYNLLNVAVRWRTSLLTCLAFMLVTGLLVRMLAFVNGMYALTETSGQPGNLIILSEGVTDESFSNLGFSNLGNIDNQPGILRVGDRPLASREVYLVVNQPIENAAAGRPPRRFLQVRGIDEPLLAAQVHAIELFEGGQWFSEAGVVEYTGDALPQIAERSAIQVVIGEGIARELGHDRKPAVLAQARNRDRLDTGDVLPLNDRLWLVVGVMKSSGSTFDSEVWVRRSVAAPMFGKNTYSSIVVRTADETEALKLKEYFNTGFKDAAVTARTEKEYFSSLSETNKQFLYSAIFTTFVMAFGGAFGIMNTMFAAINLRTKDIGVMRLLGYGRVSILLSFLFESLLIALVGGALGCILGSFVDGVTTNSVVSSGQGAKFVVLRYTVDMPTLARGMILSLITGFLGGLIPAISAMRRTALDALR